MDDLQSQQPSIENSLDNNGAVPDPAVPFRSAASPPPILPSPTTAINLVGFEVALEEGEIQPQDNIDHTRYRRLAKNIDKFGLYDIVDAAYDDEVVADSTIFKKFNRDQWFAHCEETLSTMHPDMLKATIRGDVVAPIMLNPELKKVYQVYGKRGSKQPCIYIRELTLGEQYERFTVGQARDLALVAKQYANRVPAKNEEAYIIDKAVFKDKWSHEQSDRGERGFLNNKYGKYTPELKRKLLSFSRALGKIASRAEDEGKSHIPGLTYTGYTNDASARGKAHSKLDHDTNWLVYFAFHVAQLLKWEPHMSMVVVSFLTSAEMAPVSEMLIARLANSYYFAGGLNNAHAGGSVASALDVKDWVPHRKWVWDETEYRENEEKEMERRREWQQREPDAKQAEIDAKNKVIADRVVLLRQERNSLRDQIDEEAWAQDPFFAPYLEEYQTIDQDLKDYDDFMSRPRNGRP